MEGAFEMILEAIIYAGWREKRFHETGTLNKVIMSK
jgi:hypothetical protein